MATREIEQGEEPARAGAFLAERGIAPGIDGVYPEAAVLAAIRSRGWLVTVTGEPGDWSADVGEERGPDASDDVWLLASGRDRQVALLRALDAALLWLDRDAARAALDREARERLGIGGEEFLRRRSVGEFDDVDFEPAFSDVARLDTLVVLAR